MQIQKIKLRNFRNFKKCDIEFSCDKDKNFTIILGQNTFGKTTLVKAFIWCLYRVNLFDNKILLNSDVATTMTSPENCSVEIELSHKNCSYKITTRELYCINPSGNLSIANKATTTVIKVDGINSYTITSPQKVDEEINNILRSDLKEYFFFDGESNSIDSVSKKKNLTDAVSNILGLAKIEQLKDYFDPNKADSVSIRFQKELIDDSDGLDNYQGTKDNLISKKENLENDRRDISEEIEKLNIQRSEKENILDANSDVTKYQTEKKQLESKINNGKFQKEQDMKNLVKMINTNDAYLKILFGYAYTKFNLSELKNNSSFKSGDSFVGITEAAVDQLIKRGRCICGCEITNGNDAYNHLISAREHMEPHDYGKYIEDFDSSESSNVYNANTIYNNINDSAKSILDLIQEIDDDESRLKSVKKDIEGRIDVGEIQRDIGNIDRQIGQKQKELSHINNDIPSIESQLADINEKIKKSTINNQKNDFTNLCFNYAYYIYKVADKKMKESKTLIKARLQKEVSEIFESMYHGNRGIRINDDFKAETYVVSAGEDKKIDGSTGLGTVVNYSFVAGLMNLAKKAIINGDNDDVTADPELVNETYPLVMDAPFSNTDETHIENICNVLPNYCDQIIMFVMRKDFKYASQSISDKIGKMYELEQISETESIVQEVSQYGFNV